MALKDTSRGSLWSSLHFVLRVLGLTGLVAALGGVVLAGIWNLIPGWDDSLGFIANLRTLGSAAATRAVDTVQGVLDQLPGDTMERIIVGLVLIGGALALLALLVEVIGGVFLVAGRRSAFGGNALIQVGLALALLLGINVYAQWDGNYRRFDLTRERQFTLPAAVQADLGKLQGKTTIVVYQMHKALGFLPDEKRDRYSDAAERKVVEKVKDLVEEFREFGPQFQVVVLDSTQDDVDTQLAALPAELRQAIEKAPENSIFFDADSRVQRLSFNDFYALDKTSSQDQGNLVLRYYGKKPFADRVLTIDERRPRVAVGVIHPLLSMQGGSSIWGMAGVKQSLEANGFDTRDLLLKKEGPTDLDPATYTFEESKLEQIDEQIADLEDTIKSNDAALAELEKRHDEWTKQSLAKLADTDLGRSVKRQLDITSDKDFTEDVRKKVLARIDDELSLARTIVPLSRERAVKELEAQREERKSVAKAEDSLAEQRRLSDLHAKTARILADCDMLILPRATLFDINRGPILNYGLYKLDPGQVSAIREFVRSGKPILVCFGPANSPPGRPDMDAGGDGVDEMLAGLGLHLSRQTVLFNVESKSFGQRRGGLVIAGTNVEVPPLRFDDWQPGTGLPAAKRSETQGEAANPLRESLRLTARSLGKETPLDLRLRHPRPIYFDPSSARLPGALGLWTVAPQAGGLAGVSWGSLFLFGRPGHAARFDPNFLMTDADSWNEGQPFPTRERVPHYEPPKADEAVTDPYESRRTGPFPVGVAVEVPNWYSTASGEAPPLRVAAIGQGGVFIGTTLPPAREKLLLDTCNWLLGRDEQLTRAGTEWKYPRVQLTERHRALWFWGAVFGPPLLFLWFGSVVMLRRLTR